MHGLHQLELALAAFVLLLRYGSGTVTYKQFNLTQYKQMPALYQLEDYDLCLDKTPNHILSHRIYCMVYAEIVPNANSSVWQQIEELTHDEKHYFRHDHLFLGVCLERCKRTLHELSHFQVQQLYEGKVTDLELSSYYARVHKRPSDERIHYDHLINSCLNRDFQRKFQMRLRSSIEYCEWANEHLEHDALDVFVYVLLAVLLLFTVLSSIYDFHLKRKQADPVLARGNLFYKNHIKLRSQRFLCAFSLCRNFYRLTLPTDSEFSRDLRFFDAFRMIGVFFVIMGHTLMAFMTVQIQNPEFFEQFLNKFETSILQNGSAVIQIFFVMSAFLLYVNFSKMQYISKETGALTCVAIYFRVFINRYLRLLPSLALLIVFNGTILTRLGNGPFWRHLTEAERVFCRENWWKNMIFVNNHMMEDGCAQQTWYMAADMQLFEFFLIVIIITKKHPGTTKFIYLLLLLAAFAVPGFITYFLRLDAVYHIKPETYRYLYFRHSETFYQTYPPFYTNMGGYFMGFLCGHFYLKMRSGGLNLKGKWKSEFGMWLLVPAALLVLFSGFIFIKYDFEKPSIWLAIYAGVIKNFWIMICGGFVCSMCCKVGWIAYEFCSLPFFRPFARISFQAFLWHVFVLRLVTGYFRDPVYINSFFLFGNIVLVFVLTQIMAFFMALIFEYPLTEILKLLMMHNRNTTKTTPESQIEFD